MRNLIKKSVKMLMAMMMTSSILLPTIASAQNIIVQFNRGDGAQTKYFHGCYDSTDLTLRNYFFVQMNNILSTDVTIDKLTTTPGMFKINVNNTSDSLTTLFYKADGAYCDMGAVEIRFQDGVVWDSVTALDNRIENVINGTSRNETLRGTAKNDALNGLGGRDILNGNEGNDVLNGGNGNDDLNGGIGNDTYVFEGNFGYDFVKDIDKNYGSDIIEFKNINSSQVVLTKSGYDLMITVNSSNRIKVIDYFYSRDYEIELIKFADNVTWDYFAVKNRVK